MRVLEDGAMLRHISTGGEKCPFCGSLDIHGGSTIIGPGRMEYTMDCLNCEGEWTDIFVLTGVEILGEGLEKIFPDSGRWCAIGGQEE